MMPVKSPKLLDRTLQCVKQYAADGDRDVLILVSSPPERSYAIARNNGELTQQDKEMLTSEGIPKDSWENDAMIMKGRYLKDCRVKSSVSVEELLMWKREALEKITSLLNQSTKPIVVLHYIGPGRRPTGDWCFHDHDITFDDIATLYTKHFRERILVIVSDCSYSGKWVESCKRFLDKYGVQPCGHSARKNGIKLKVYGSCQPDQIGNSLIYSARGNGNEKNTGCHYLWPTQSIAPDQTTYGNDFTEITCGKTLEEECALGPNFTFQKKNKTERIHIFRGIHQGRRVWRILELVDDFKTIREFKEKTQGGNVETQNIKLSDYGKIMNSGWGQDPPQEVIHWIAQAQKGLEK